MAYLGSWKIDDFITFYVNTHTAATGAATDADAVPPYRIYEDETGAAITNGNMALLDAANTDGFYSERLQLLAATGFEKGKQYAIYISATVATVVGTIHHTFQIEAEVDANTVSGTVANVTTVTGNVNGSVGSVTGAVGSVTGAVGSVTGNVGGNVTGSVGSVVGAVGSVTGAVGSVIGAVGSVTGNVGGNVTGTVASVVGAVGSVTGNVGGNVTGTVASVVGNVDGNVTGSVGSVVGAVGSVTGAVGSVTGNLGGDVVGNVQGDVQGNVDGSVASVTGAAGSVTGAVGSVTGNIGGNLAGDVQGNVDGTVATTTTNTDMRGTDNAALAATALTDVTWTDARAGYLDELAAANIPADLDNVLLDTGTTIPGTITTLQADTDDIQTRLPAALVTGRMSSDAAAISGSTDAADKLEASAETIVIGTVSTDNTAASTTTFVSDDITEATADHFNGRIVIFTSGALTQQATDITDYVLDGNNEGAFTVTALTEAPANNVTFVIV